MIRIICLCIIINWDSVKLSRLQLWKLISQFAKISLNFPHASKKEKFKHQNTTTTYRDWTMTTPKQYVVEHLDVELEGWSKLEYLTIATECRPNPSSTTTSSPTFHLTSLPQELFQNLPEELKNHENLNATTEEVVLLDGLKAEEVCLLDPRADRDMCPEDGDVFRWFVFGGILGW